MSRSTLLVACIGGVGLAAWSCNSDDQAGASTPAAAAAPGVVAPAAPAAPAGPPPNLVVVVIDTLRPDHLGAYGYGRPTSPNLDALAARGVRFNRAYSQSGWTLASFASMLTGLYPNTHRVVQDPQDAGRFGCLASGYTTLPEALSTRGYTSAGFINNTFLAPEFEVKQGFDLYDFAGATNDEHRTSVETADKALAWLATQPGPTFSLVHFMEPHLDYMPPPETAGTFTSGERPEQLAMIPGEANPFTAMQTGSMEPTERTRAYTVDLYDEEVLAADLGLGHLIAGLDTLGMRDNTIVVVTSDHGEEFWEHGRFEHGHALWSELTRVPLIIAGPGLPIATVDTVVEHVDLFQGLLAAAGAERPELSRGQNLFAVASQGGLVNRVALSENCLYGPECISVVDDRSRLVFLPDERVVQVWEVDGQMRERVRLEGDAQTDEGRRLMKLMGVQRGGLASIAGVAGPRVPNVDTFQQLAALGYVDMEAYDPDASSTDGCAAVVGGAPVAADAPGSAVGDDATP